MKPQPQAQAGWRFSYNELQWDAISSTLREGCSEPSSWRADIILREANTYLAELPRHKPVSQRVQAWRHNARLADQFHKLASEGVVDVTSKKLSLRDDTPANLWRAVIGEDEYADFLQTIKRCQVIAEAEADSILNCDYGPNHPRFAFLESILLGWLEAGGGLRASRASNRDYAGAPDGPLVRHVRAVTVPVMGEAAPNPETIYKLIRRTKAKLGKMFLFDAAGRHVRLENGDFATR